MEPVEGGGAGKPLGSTVAWSVRAMVWYRAGLWRPLLVRLHKVKYSSVVCELGLEQKF